MTIYHRLKVWAIKGWRIVRYAFVYVQPRTVNQIFRTVVNKRCDYCGNGPMTRCVVLECDLEVYATICESCTNTLWKVFNPDDVEEIASAVATPSDPRGVVVG